MGATGDCATVTEAEPVAVKYISELVPSGVYLAVKVSEPAASDPAGIVIEAEPELRDVAGDA